MRKAILVFRKPASMKAVGVVAEDYQHVFVNVEVEINDGDLTAEFLRMKGDETAKLWDGRYYAHEIHNVIWLDG